MSEIVDYQARVEELENDLKDFETVIRHCSIIYDHASGGVISKPMTDPHVVMDMLDDRITEQVNEAEIEARNSALEAAAKECEKRAQHYQSLIDKKESDHEHLIYGSQRNEANCAAMAIRLKKSGGGN